MCLLTTFTSKSGYAVYVGAVSSGNTVVGENVVNVVAQGTANITGGTFSGSEYAVYVDNTVGTTILGNCGKLNVSGGTFGKLYVAGIPSGEVELSGGTFENIEAKLLTNYSQILESGYSFYTKDENDNYTVLTAGTEITDKAVAVKLCTHTDADEDGKCDICDTALTISVTITWTAMEFTYTDGKWNSTTHSYDAGTWSTSGGTITVENTGSVAVTVSFGYVSTLGDVSGSFTKASFNLAAGASDATALKLSGKPSTSLDNAAIGNVTITVAKAKQGWQTENGATYYYVNGEKTTEWLKIDDNWYYFDADGTMKTGWLADVVGYEGEWFYFDPTTGAMQTDWCTDIAGYEGQWFYFDPDTGVMQTGWVQDGNSNWYYFDTDGTMKTGWMQIGENWYYFDEQGYMVTNKYVDNIWVDADGKAQAEPNV